MIKRNESYVGHYQICNSPNEAMKELWFAENPITIGLIFPKTETNLWIRKQREIAYIIGCGHVSQGGTPI